MLKEAGPEQEAHKEIIDRLKNQETDMLRDSFKRKETKIGGLIIAALILGCSGSAQAKEQDPQKIMQKAHERLYDILEGPLFTGATRIKNLDLGSKEEPATKKIRQEVEDLMKNGEFGELIRMGMKMKPGQWRRPPEKPEGTKNR